MHPARRLWATLEPLHALVYFTPEVREAGKAIGLRGYWDTYFAFRAAPLGPVSAPAVVAMFAGFEPGMVARSLPSAWSRASVETCLATRSTVAADAMRTVGVLADACATAVSLLSPLDLATTGRPLGAANAALPLPDDPVGALWQITTTLREHRGDGHVAALTAAGLSGLDAVQLQLAPKGLDAETMRQVRGWSVDQWASARSSLLERGLLEEGGLTADGTALLAGIEETTDSLAWHGGLSTVPVDEVVEVLAPAVAAVWGSGLVPAFNPVGVPRTS
ncbi:SCO6745 family protein [Actinophytocola sp.]|uniref:SCO6745 family protein n=1 Tax=Actinophytocola sp. TaxID=1872138 RepID=UPI002ED3A1F3